MDYISLVKTLQKKYNIHLDQREDSPKITDVKLIDDSISCWNENTLYLGSLENVQYPPERPIMLLGIDNNCSLPQGSYFTFVAKELLYDLFYMCKDLLLEDLRGDAELFHLAQSVLEGKSVVHIINTAANLLGNALIIVDSGLKVLAHSTHYEIMDPLWCENIERGFYSYEFMQKVRSSKHMKEWSKKDGETQLIKLPGDQQPKLVARITCGGQLSGAIVMIAHHRAVSNYHIRQLPLIGKILFERLNHDDSKGVQKSLHSTILYNLLNESNVSDTLKLIDMSKVTFPAKMYVIVARFLQPVENRYLKRSIRIELERIFPNGHSVQYKSYISVVVPSISNSQRDELWKLAELEDINIGISWPFQDPMGLKRYFNQAVSSIKGAQSFCQSHKVVNYTNFSYYDLLSNYTGKIPLQHYCHPATQLLRDYDTANSTEFYLTLRTYLECNKNLTTTAEALFLHRNSLTYRINRINELTGLDLNDINVVFSLIDSFRIESFLSSMVSSSSKSQ